jgi:two-component system response regulator CitB
LPHLADAQTQIESKRPQLVLLDNYLPDGKGITLIDNAMLARTHCSVIFITAASDMDTCSLAIRNGAFDYILKPVSWKRLNQSLERFMQFAEQQRCGRLSISKTWIPCINCRRKTTARIAAAKASREYAGAGAKSL